MFRKITGFCLMLMIAACQPSSNVTPFAATLPVGQTNNVAQVATAVPTANPIASRTATLPPTATFTPTLTPTSTPTPTITPTASDTFTPSPTSTSVPIASATPTNPADDPNNTPVPTWTPPPPDPSTKLADHYHFSRPIGEDGVTYIARTYPYGSTAGGLQMHLGVDLENPTGTPILAAADGVVYYAGDDSATQFGPTTNYYGNLVVIQHGFTDSQGQPVFSLYGHMQHVEVQAGQTVKKGDRIGIVGSTGVAFGPHLHFEVRVGSPNDFHSTRDPELWIFPYRGYGTLVGLVTDANGTKLYNAPLQVKSTDITRYAFSYANDTANSDPVFGENVVLGDLPANYYNVTVSDNGRLRFQKLIYIYPNRSTWIDIKLNN